MWYLNLSFKFISAAHCFVDATGMPYPKENYKIAAGKHYRRYDDARDKKAQYSSVNTVKFVILAVQVF